MSSKISHFGSTGKKKFFVIILLLYSMLFGLFLGLGPLSNLSPFKHRLSAQLIALESASHLNQIYIRLEKGEIDEARLYILNRMTRSINFVNESSNSMKWNEFECQYINHLEDNLGINSAFREIRPVIANLNMRFCEKENF